MYLSSHTLLWPSSLLVGKISRGVLVIRLGAAAVTPDWLKQGSWPLRPSFHLPCHLALCLSCDIPILLWSLRSNPTGYYSLFALRIHFCDRKSQILLEQYTMLLMGLFVIQPNKQISVSQTNPHCLRTIYTNRCTDLGIVLQHCLQ